MINPATLLFSQIGGETDAATPRRWRFHQFTDGIEEPSDRLIVRGEFLGEARFELVEAFSQLLVGG